MRDIFKTKLTKDSLMLLKKPQNSYQRTCVSKDEFNKKQVKHKNKSMNMCFILVHSNCELLQP